MSHHGSPVWVALPITDEDHFDNCASEGSLRPDQLVMLAAILFFLVEKSRIAKAANVLIALLISLSIPHPLGGSKSTPVHSFRKGNGSLRVAAVINSRLQKHFSKMRVVFTRSPT
jgi:hypothetical protein